MVLSPRPMRTHPPSRVSSRHVEISASGTPRLRGSGYSRLLPPFPPVAQCCQRFKAELEQSVSELKAYAKQVHVAKREGSIPTLASNSRQTLVELQIHRPRTPAKKPATF